MANKPTTGRVTVRLEPEAERLMAGEMKRSGRTISKVINIALIRDLTKPGRKTPHPYSQIPK